MSLIVVGTNHKYSPVHIREKLSFSKKRLREALNLLKGAVILSTCNRTEVYASAGNSRAGIEEVITFLSVYSRINREKILSYLYIYKGRKAISHLFMVASGLDSLIPGETQILSQVKESLLEAEAAGFTDEFLERVFFHALSCAKRAHRETKISEGKVSTGSAAIDFIKEKAGALSSRRILIIGVGKVSELVLKYLAKEDPDVVFVSNRTFKKASRLAGKIGAKAVRFDKLGHFLKKTDIIISATASPHFVIKKDILAAIKHKLLILDLALPRDVDPSVRDLENIELFYLEDLQTIIQRNAHKRTREAQKASGIVDIEVEKLWSALTKLEPEPALLP